MKKKVVSLMLVAAMAASMAACGGSSNSGSTASTGNSTSTSTEAEAEGGEEGGAEVDASAAQAAIDERIANGGSTVVCAFLNFVGPPAGLDRINQCLNEITEPELGITTDLMIMDFASYGQNMNLMLASGEQMDIFSIVGVGFMASYNKGYLYDMYEDDLIQTYGQDILAAWPEEAIKACEVAGGLYGTPVKKDDAGGLFGISIPSEYLDTIGVDYNSMYENPDDEIIFTDFDFLDDVLAKLHEAYPDKTTFYMDPSSIIGQCLPIDSVGGDNFGVLCDLDSYEITNLFEDQMYYDLCQKMYEYNQLGYISKDAMTTTDATTTQIASGTLCAYKTATKPGIRMQETGLCKTPVVIFQLGITRKTSSCYNSMPWCMNAQTEDPVAAMQLLNAFYGDERLSTILCWGQEGVEYVKNDDGSITFPEGLAADQSEYYNNTNWCLPNQFIAPVWEGNALDLWEKMEKWNNEAKSPVSLGFTFDNSDVANEFTALTNVYNEYHKQLELGFVDPAVGIPEMVEKLKAAGLDKYMAAKQAALNEWAGIE